MQSYPITGLSRLRQTGKTSPFAGARLLRTYGTPDGFFYHEEQDLGAEVHDDG